MTEIYDKNRMVVRTNIQQLNTLFTMGKELEGTVDGKQDKLIAGDGIIINGNVISVDGSGGGGGITIDDELSTESDNPVQNKVITSALNNKQDILTIDDELSSDSENPVQNKVITAALGDKQDTLTAGTNITIVDNVISSTGGGSITVDSALSSDSENPVQNKVITNALGNKLESTDISFTSTANIDRIRLTVDSTPSDVTLKTVNGNHLIGSGDLIIGLKDMVICSYNNSTDITDVRDIYSACYSTLGGTPTKTTYLVYLKVGSSIIQNESIYGVVGVIGASGNTICSVIAPYNDYDPNKDTYVFLGGRIGGSRTGTSSGSVDKLLFYNTSTSSITVTSLMGNNSDFEVHACILTNDI